MNSDLLNFYELVLSTESSTTISITKSEQHFSWEGHGLNMYFPEECLPHDIDDCSIQIRASVEGNYIFPRNSYLVSAVYWFRCIPKCKFLKPITLEIEHCAKLENYHSLSYVKAKAENISQCIFSKAADCSQTNYGIFPSCSSCGFIQLDGFCGYGVTQDGSDERQYCGNLYYISCGINYEIFFVVIWNTEEHRSVSYWMQLLSWFCK